METKEGETIAVCRECGVELNSDNWYKSLQKSHQYICKRCHTEYGSNWQKDNRERANKSKRELSARKKQNGICGRCMCRPINYRRSFSHCDICMDKINKSVNELYRKRQRENKCVNCGKKLDCHSTTWCLKCLEKHRKSGRIYRNGTDTQEYTTENLLKKVNYSVVKI